MSYADVITVRYFITRYMYTNTSFSADFRAVPGLITPTSRPSSTILSTIKIIMFVRGM
jgi:hypothetical protein